MPVSVSWLTPNRTMLIVMAGDVTLAEIPLPQIPVMLVNAPHKLDVLHDLSAMTAMYINCAQLPDTLRLTTSQHQECLLHRWQAQPDHGRYHVFYRHARPPACLCL